MGNNNPKGLLIPHNILKWHHIGIKDLSLDDDLIFYQLVGSVTDYQGDDG